ncbi:hypothetical protein Bca4012_049722 [Brassica carinata]
MDKSSEAADAPVRWGTFFCFETKLLTKEGICSFGVESVFKYLMSIKWDLWLRTDLEFFIRSYCSELKSFSL